MSLILLIYGRKFWRSTKLCWLVTCAESRAIPKYVSLCREALVYFKQILEQEKWVILKVTHKELEEFGSFLAQTIVKLHIIPQWNSTTEQMMNKALPGLPRPFMTSTHCNWVSSPAIFGNGFLSFIRTFATNYLQTININERELVDDENYRICSIKTVLIHDNHRSWTCISLILMSHFSQHQFRSRRIINRCET